MSIVMAVVFAESTASMLAVAEITGKRVSKGDIARGLAGDGASAVLAGVFNAFVDTVFTQNVGAVATTRVYSRYVTATSGAILVVLGALPKVSSVVAVLPKPVVGGVGLILFATVALVGINPLRSVDLSDRINSTIAAVAVGVGLLPELAESMFECFPSAAQILLGSSITLAAIAAFSLNLLFNHTRPGPAHRPPSPRQAPLLPTELPMNQSPSDAFVVPAVDIGPYVRAGDDTERARVAREIDEVCSRVGFVQILGHGIPDPVVDGLAGALGDFFGLPMDDKQQYRVVGANRGYNPPKSESLSLSLGVESAGRMNDFFEAYNVGVKARSFPHLDPSEDDYGLNVWPDVPGFEDRVQTYFAEASRVARTLTRIFADALGQAPTTSSGSPTTRSTCCA
jgi:hypothetical protein